MTATSMIRGVAIALFACALSDACAGLSPDYAREDRIVAEIVPAIVVGDAVYLATPRRPRVLAIFTIPAKPIAGAVIIHGLGVHADWGLINGLRTDLADAGVATLSVQMPVLAADAPRADYAALYSEAGERIAAGITFMKSQGIEGIAIVAHSLGAAMANAYLASQPSARVAAWIPIGMQDAFASQPKEPVLDIIGEDDWREVLAAAAARSRGLPRDACSRQMTIAGGDHFMASRRRPLSEAVVRFLDTVVAGGCGP
jgi:pimeloyl-ACP methyl ester carboxylesterase